MGLWDRDWYNDAQEKRENKGRDTYNNVRGTTKKREELHRAEAKKVETRRTDNKRATEQSEPETSHLIMASVWLAVIVVVFIVVSGLPRLLRLLMH